MQEFVTADDRVWRKYIAAGGSVSDAIDEALVALEHGGYIACALPADYSRPNAEWNMLWCNEYH